MSRLSNGKVNTRLVYVESCANLSFFTPCKIPSCKREGRKDAEVKYPNLFKARYQLSGSDWIRTVSPEDRRVFVEIGLQEGDHGQKGGRALYMQRGREYLSEIGRRGAVMTNIRKWWDRMVKEETERELGIVLDY